MLETNRNKSEEIGANRKKSEQIGNRAIGTNRGNPPFCRHQIPEGPARRLDASRQKLTPYCLAAIFDSQLPSPELSLKMPPRLPLPHKRGHLSSFKIDPVVRVTARQLSSKNCLAAIFASRHQDASPGPLGLGAPISLRFNLTPPCSLVFQ